MIIHHGYFRSSSSYRCRIALNLKGTKSEYRPVHLLKDGGQQKKAVFAALNPQKLVPVLEFPDGNLLTQSPAILEWIEETYPQPPLLPSNSYDRAKVRAFCALIGCDIHPLQNLRVLQYLSAEFGTNQERTNEWCQRWIGDGLMAAEELLIARANTRFAFGDTPGMAEVYLMPQLYSAERFGVDLTAMPRLGEIAQTCGKIEAFQSAHPSMQVDAE